MQDAPSILSTKTLDKASHDFISLHGWHLREEDFIEIVPLVPFRWTDYTALGKYLQELSVLIRSMDEQSLVIFTSEKGVEHRPRRGLPLEELGKPLPMGHPDLWQIACLSGKTLQAVEASFREDQIIFKAKNAGQLAADIARDGRFSNAVFFCAQEHRPELPVILRQAGIRVTEFPVYKTIGQSKVIDSPFEAVLFFSPSGADSFFETNTIPRGGVCFAIGETTANAIKNYTDERIIISDTPSQEELLHCVQFYYDNKQCYL